MKDYLCNQGESYPPRPKIKVNNSLPYLIILYIIQKLNSIITFVLVFIQNVSTFLTTLHILIDFLQNICLFLTWFQDLTRYSFLADTLQKVDDIYYAFFGGIFFHFFHSVSVRNLANLSLKHCELFVCSQLCINS